MNIRDYISERITKNHLPLNVDECLAVVKTYETIYANVSEEERFFLMILNNVGVKLTDINEDMSEILGWLRVHKSKQNIVYFLFETEEDYYNWLSVRTELYNKLNDKDCIRLLNFVELSTMNFISDILTKSTYVLTNGKTEITINKDGYGVDVDSVSFIKYLGTKFKEGYSFIPKP